MRIKITFNRTKGSRMLPMDYQYGLSSWVYNVLQTADKEFSQFLHDTGYQDGSKTFKFFTLSELNLYPFKVRKEQNLFELEGDTFQVQISFLMDRIGEEFVKGLFVDQKGFLGNRFNGIDFEVKDLQVLPSPVFQPTMRYRTISPIFLNYKEGKRIIHLHPIEHKEQYAQRFLENLRQKQRIFQLHTHQTIQFKDKESWDFRLLKASRTRLIRIKPFTKAATKIRTCHMDFELTAPIEVHEIAYEAGFGSENSWGCGMVDVLGSEILKNV